MAMISKSVGWLLIGVSAPLLAQTAGPQIDLRVGKLEREMRAVQRTVFPQGAPVQPDLLPADPVATAPGNAASTPLADLETRVGALEKQVAALTGQVEQNGFRTRQHDEALARVQTRLTALEGGATPGVATNSTPSETTTIVPPSATRPPVSQPAPADAAMRRAPAPAPVSAKPGAAKSDPARKAAVAEVEMPATGDAPEDAYTYGFRLYTAKFFPEAQAKLKEFTGKYSATTKRWSYAQNLLGRAYLDEGKPALAAVAFYDNYQKAPRGERAAESLTWLGQALTRLKKLTDACKVYDELADVYGATLTSEQRTRAAKGRTDAKCPA